MAAVTIERHPSGGSSCQRPANPSASTFANTSVGERTPTPARGPLVGLAALVCLVLGSCGGGGGDSPTNVSASGSAAAGPAYTVQGTVRVAEMQTVDSDTNDSNQPGRRSNNSFATAQRLPNPGVASGYLTLPGQGPVGAVSQAGDLVDGYRAYLYPGQVIELVFNSEADQANVDLFLYDKDAQVVGMSTSSGNHECIQVTAEGDYLIAAHLIADSSTTGTIYQLRVSRPGSIQCTNVQGTAASLDSDGIIAIANPRDTSPLTVTAKARAAHLSVRHPGGNSGAILLDLPASEQALVRALSAQAMSAAPAIPAIPAAPATPGMPGTPALSASSFSPDEVIRKAELTATGDPDWYAGLSEQARRVHATVNLSRALVRGGRYIAASPNVLVQTFADQLDAFPPNDPYYGFQAWHYEQIGLPAAINRLVSFKGAAARPIVAVVDSGIVAAHPDLQGQLVAGHDLVSDARNGDGDGIDADPEDAGGTPGWSFHGTLVAGLVAASTYNGIGTAGTAPIARVMPVRVIASLPALRTAFDIWQGIAYAAGLDNASGQRPPRRADIINLSLGWYRPCDAAFQNLFDQVRAAGVWVVAAAGNGSSPESRLLGPVGAPANCDHVLAVGALDAQRRKASYSSVGPALALMAPGGDWMHDPDGAVRYDRVYTTTAVDREGQRAFGWAGTVGTSMAAPQVAGVLALMRWVNPELRIETVEQWLEQGRIVDDLGPEGRDDHFGHGLVNAEKAVIAALESLGAGVQPPAGGRIVARPRSLTLGSLGQTAEVTLALPGASGEALVSVAADSSAISVAPKAGAVDPVTGLGTYVVTANRAMMAENTSAFPNLLVTLAPERVLKVPVSIERRATIGGVSTSAGALYVLAVDVSAETLRIVSSTTVAAPVQGAYAYRLTVPGTARIAIYASSDLDNDQNFCSLGESCGGYADWNNGERVLEPAGSLTGIDFSVLPSGGLGADVEAGALRQR